MKILNIITNVEGKAASEAGKVYNLQGKHSLSLNFTMSGLAKRLCTAILILA